MLGKNKKHEEHDNSERWLVSYADFITLLFAFFVVLYATSTQNVEKEKKFEEVMREKFRMTGGQGAGTTGPRSGSPIGGNAVEVVDFFQRRNLPSEDLQEYIEQLLNKNMSADERKTTIQEIRHDDIGVRISLAASTFFPSGSAKLRLPATKSLDKIAHVLKLANRRIIIEGHTDDIPIVGGQFESNWELAGLRATSVVRYLIKVHKLDSTSLAAISYADQRPLVPNTTEENRAKNRRIEILIINSDDTVY